MRRFCSVTVAIGTVVLSSHAAAQGIGLRIQPAWTPSAGARFAVSAAGRTFECSEGETCWLAVPAGRYDIEVVHPCYEPLHLPRVENRGAGYAPLVTTARPEPRRELRLRIPVSPDADEVLLDDRPLVSPNRSDWMVTTNAGSHRVDVQKNGYARQSLTLDVCPATSGQGDVVLPAVLLRPTTSRVSVKAEPDGALVTVRCGQIERSCTAQRAGCGLLPLPIGTCTYRVSAPDVVTRTGEVGLRGPTDILEVPPPVPLYVNLMLETRPSVPATFQVGPLSLEAPNGRLRADAVRSGVVGVLVRAPGFRPKKVAAMLLDRDTSIAARLSPLPSDLDWGGVVELGLLAVVGLLAAANVYVLGARVHPSLRVTLTFLTLAFVPLVGSLAVGPRTGVEVRSVAEAQWARPGSADDNYAWPSATGSAAAVRSQPSRRTTGGGLVPEGSVEGSSAR